MLSNFKKLISRIESSNSGIAYWLLAFLSVILVRNFLEGLLEVEHEILNPQYYFIEYAISYLLLFLGLLILLRIFTKENITDITKVLIVCFILILIVPVIDFIVSSGAGYPIKYLTGDAGYLSKNFITYYSTGAASIGQRVEAIGVGVFLMLYMLLKTKSYLKTAVGTFFSYALFVAWSALPSCIYAVSNFFFKSPLPSSMVDTNGVFDRSILHTYVSPQVVTLVTALLIVLAIAITYLISDKKRSPPLSKIIRPIRTAHYALLALFGLALGVEKAGPLGFDLYNVLMPLAFIISAVLAYMFACAINDILDGDLHRRTNLQKNAVKTRPLWVFAMICAALSLLLAYALGEHVVVILVTFISLAFLYSAPPLRLKAYPIIASLTLATWALLIILAGFAVFAKSKAITLFPPEIAILVLVVYTLGTNYKDLKDYNEDKKQRVYTIPVLFGEHKGRIIIGAMVALSFALVPFILQMWQLLVSSMIASTISLALIWKGAHERYFRVMHLAYCVIVGYALFF